MFNIQFLEEHGKLKQFKRFAGASAGAIFASFLALGADCKTIKSMTAVPMDDIAEGIINNNN